MKKKSATKKRTTRHQVAPVVQSVEMGRNQFRVRHREIFELRDKAERLLGLLLRATGWESSNKHTPRMLWKWEKQIGNTILIAATAEDALTLQDKISWDILD